MKAKKLLILPIIAMGVSLMVGCGSTAPSTSGGGTSGTSTSQQPSVNTYTLKFVDNHVEETPVTLKTLSLKEGTVIAAKDLPEVPSYTKAYYNWNFDYFYKLVGAEGEEEEVKLEPGVTKATENATYYAKFKKGDMVSFKATVNLPGGKQTVEFNPANWNTKRDEIIALTPKATDLLDPLVPKVAPTGDVEYNVISSDDNQQYFDYDFSTLSALPERMKMYNDGLNAPTLEWDNNNKEMVFFDQGAANLYIASHVKNFELEFSVKSADVDRLAINFGSTDNDDLSQSFNNGVNCNAGFVFCPNHGGNAISRPWEAKTEAGNYYGRADRITNFVKKPLSAGVKFRIQSYNGAFKIFMDDQFVHTYMFKEANYNGGFISISRGDGSPTYKFYDHFKLQPFDGSKDFYDSVFYTDGSSVKHVNDFTASYRTGFGDLRIGIETADGVDKGAMKLVAGNTTGLENFFTSFEYEEFVAEFTIKAGYIAEDKISFIVIPTAGISNNQGEQQACPEGGFRATLVPDHASVPVRYRTAALASDEEIKDVAGGCKSIKTNYIHIKVQMEKTTNGHKATFWFADEGATLAKIGETIELTGYVGGHVGFAFGNTGYVKDFSIKGLTK